MHHVIYDHHADSAITGTPVSSWVVHMNGLVQDCNISINDTEYPSIFMDTAVLH